MKLSDFKGEEGLKVVGRLLLPAGTMVANPKVAKAAGKGLVHFLSAALENCPRQMMEIFAIVNNKSPEEYDANGETVLMDALELFEDPALLRLFGLQS
jgi:hypothetical protein